MTDNIDIDELIERQKGPLDPVIEAVLQHVLCHMPWGDIALPNGKTARLAPINDKKPSLDLVKDGKFIFDLMLDGDSGYGVDHVEFTVSHTGQGGMEK